MPNIIVTISIDRMLAYVSGTLADCGSKEAAASVVRDALEKEGVVFGVQEHLVDLAASQFVQGQTVLPTIVAIGDYVQPEKSAGLQFSVPTYPRNLFPPDFKFNDERPIHYHQLKALVGEPLMVKEHEVVGKFGGPGSAVSGTNVFGDPDSADAAADTLMLSNRLGPGLVSECGTSNVLSRKRGIVVAEKDSAWVLAVLIDGATFFSLSADRLSLRMDLFPPGPGGRELSKTDVLCMVSQQHPRVRNVDAGEIEKCCAAVKANAAPVRAALIASGIPPVRGNDEKIEYFVNLSFSQRPEIMEDGHANYYSIHLFESVKARQRLGRRVPATEGIPGADVLGEAILAEKGRPLALTLGKNVEPLVSDPSCIVASKDGNVYVRNDNIFVEEVLRIKSDVDFHTGDVYFTGDIEIEGDITSGFTVKTSGDLVVRGAVEDAVVEAGRSVIVYSGFVGSGRGKIKAGCDVVLKYVRNQTVLAQNNIMIDGESMDANLCAGNEMFVEVKKSWIMGGSAVAKNRIRAFSIGNPSCAHTEVATGIDALAQKLLEDLEREIASLREESDIISANIKQLAESGNLSGTGRGNIPVMQKKLEDVMEKYDHKLAQLSKYRDHYQKAIYDTGGDIGALNAVYPGVVVKIGNLSHLVNAELKDCLFYVHEGRIACRSLS